MWARSPATGRRYRRPARASSGALDEHSMLVVNKAALTVDQEQQCSISGSGTPVHVTTVLGRKDSPHAGFVVDGIQHAVAAPVCCPPTLELAL